MYICYGMLLHLVLLVLGFISSQLKEYIANPDAFASVVAAAPAAAAGGGEEKKEEEKKEEEEEEESDDDMGFGLFD